MSKAKTNKDIPCIACAVQGGQIILPVERIAETNHFVVEQDSECPIEGFVVIASKRHVYSVDELTKGEIEDFSRLLVATRRAMRKVLGISKVTLVQEENTTTSHFHVWLFPWHDWMTEKWNGKTCDMEEIMRYSMQKETSEEEKEIIRLSADKLRQEMRSIVINGDLTKII